MFENFGRCPQAERHRLTERRTAESGCLVTTKQQAGYFNTATRSRIRFGCFGQQPDHVFQYRVSGAFAWHSVTAEINTVSSLC